MKRKVLILGSSGSIGVQALDVLQNFKDEFEVVGLSVHKSIERLESQVSAFEVPMVAITEENAVSQFQSKNTQVKVYSGADGLLSLIAESGADIVINALVGFAGLSPTLETIKLKKRLLLANKESLVVAGEIIMQEAQKQEVEIIPIDSEHSAIFQCLNGSKKSDIEKLILTCSGGSFYGKTKEELQDVTVDDALNHPNWDMGAKITIDSATLINKGLEIIEAMHLFNVSLDQIEVVIHRQSIVHSLVQFKDGNVLAQANLPDMRFPISYALFYPERRFVPDLPRLDFLSQNWTFDKPDTETFIALDLAKQAIQKGGTYPTVLNTANEIAVQLFLEKKISFLEISEFIREKLEKHQDVDELTLEKVFEVDQKLRKNFA